MPISRRNVIASAAALALGTKIAPGTAQSADIVTGAGSSFMAPVIKKWIELARAQNVGAISYAPIGSTNGLNKVLAGDVDFGASDSPLPDETVANSSLVQVPIVIGAITCVVNLPGVKSDRLTLSAKLLADIYTGKIKKWNDPEIAAINRRRELPDLDILPIIQANLSGTSFIFTQYLLATNPDWREKHGARVTKRWAIGSAVQNNATMIEVVRARIGSLGYMAYPEALEAGLTTVGLRNKAGKGITADTSSFTAGTQQADWSKSPNLVVDLLDQPGVESWPILTQHYVQLPNNSPHGKATRKFLEFALTHGDAAATELGFVPLPQAARTAVLGRLANPKT